MKSRLVLLLGLFCLSLVAADGDSSTTVFTRYLGTLKHEKLGREQLAKLDFIPARGNENQLELMAVFTLHFGDFRSGEYVAYHFNSVKYNPLTGSLVFDHPGQDMTIKVEKFDGNVLQGVVRSRLGGGLRMFFSLQREGFANPAGPIVEPLGGQYEAVCDGTKRRLQIQTFRSTQNVVETANPFAAYEIRAQMGEYRSDLCLASKLPCTEALFDQGSYNFFRGQLALVGEHKNLNCNVRGNDLICGRCEYRRVSAETSGPRAFSLPSIKRGNAAETPALLGDVTSIEGDYAGFLHHEYLDQYQLANVSVVTSQGTGAEIGSLKLSPVASLMFGDGETHEFITYKFNERAYPMVTVEKKKLFLFERVDADTDAVLQITSMGKGTIKGVWYSLLFGRVGTFELRKDAVPVLPAGLARLDAMGGWYESSEWDIELHVRQGETPRNTNNPFFPLSFGGFFYNKDGILPKTRIGGGTYDFYTGKISLQWGDDRRMFVGVRDIPNRVRLGLSSRVIGSPLQPTDLKLFRYSRGRGEFP